MARVRTAATLGIVSVLAAIVLTAAPAAAAHHHHHHHHHGGGSGITCGPGTVNVGGVCTPTSPGGPVGTGNVTIFPNSVTMNLDGSFSIATVVTGLPPSTAVTFSFASLLTACPGSLAAITIGTVDALGRLQMNFRESGPCVPGTYPITFTETGSPFQTFTGFVTLHF